MSSIILYAPTIEKVAKKWANRDDCDLSIPEYSVDMTLFISVAKLGTEARGEFVKLVHERRFSAARMLAMECSEKRLNEHSILPALCACLEVEPRATVAFGSVMLVVHASPVQALHIMNEAKLQSPSKETEALMATIILASSEFLNSNDFVVVPETLAMVYPRVTRPIEKHERGFMNIHGPFRITFLHFDGQVEKSLLYDYGVKSNRACVLMRQQLSNKKNPAKIIVISQYGDCTLNLAKLFANNSNSYMPDVQKEWTQRLHTQIHSELTRNGFSFIKTCDADQPEYRYTGEFNQLLLVVTWDLDLHPMSVRTVCSTVRGLGYSKPLRVLLDLETNPWPKDPHQGFVDPREEEIRSSQLAGLPEKEFATKVLGHLQSTFGTIELSSAVHDEDGHCLEFAVEHSRIGGYEIELDLCFEDNEAGARIFLTKLGHEAVLIDYGDLPHVVSDDPILRPHPFYVAQALSTTALELLRGCGI